MFNNPYMMNYSPSINQQGFNERIDNEITRLQQMKEQIQKPVQQPTNLTQNFQLAPTSRDVIRYATSLEEVQRDMVIGETPYFSKDMSVVWIKNVKGDIKTYELTEIVPKDEKDIQIEMLQEQINELKKGMIVNEQPITNDDTEQNETNTTNNDETIGNTIKESKSSSVSRVSTSKKK